MCLFAFVAHAQMNFKTYQADGPLKKLQNDQRQRYNDLNEFKKIKFYMISGNFEQALFELKNLNPLKYEIRLIKKKYLAIIYYALGKYELGLKELSGDSINKYKYYKSICLLKILGQLATKEDGEIVNKEFKHCYQILKHDSPNELLWAYGITALSHKGKDEFLAEINTLYQFYRYNKKIEWVKSWLKLHFYLNKEEYIIPLLHLLPKKIENNPEIKELISFNQYRLERNLIDKSNILNINSVNALNMQGNLAMSQGKYKKAYNHFKKVLKKKENSKNALERLIVLSWILAKWSEGIFYLNKANSFQGSREKYHAIKAAFYVKMHEYHHAENELIHIKSSRYGVFSPIVAKLLSYTYLMLGNTSQTQKYSQRNCKYYDGINCWLYFQFSIWDNITGTLKRDDKIHSKQFDIQELKQPAPLDPLKEEKYIEQSDIDELDKVIQ